MTRSRTAQVDTRSDTVNYRSITPIDFSEDTTDEEIDGDEDYSPPSAASRGDKAMRPGPPALDQPSQTEKTGTGRRTTYHLLEYRLCPSFRESPYIQLLLNRLDNGLANPDLGRASRTAYERARATLMDRNIVLALVPDDQDVETDPSTMIKGCKERKARKNQDDKLERIVEVQLCAGTIDRYRIASRCIFCICHKYTCSLTGCEIISSTSNPISDVVASPSNVRQSSSSSTSRPVRRQSCASVASGTSSARASNSDFPSAPMTRSQDLSSVHLREDGRLKATAFKRSLAPTSIEAHQFPVKRSRPLSTTPAIAESSSPTLKSPTQADPPNRKRSRPSSVHQSSSSTSSQSTTIETVPKSQAVLSAGSSTARSSTPGCSTNPSQVPNDLAFDHGQLMLKEDRKFYLEARKAWFEEYLMLTKDGGMTKEEVLALLGPKPEEPVVQGRK